MLVCVRMLQMADLQTDNEDVQRSVQQLKKKCQKMTAELQDTKLHLEGLQSRNHDLEKKQRKSVCVSVSTVSVCLRYLCVCLMFSYKDTENILLFPLWMAWHRHSDPLRRTTKVFFNLNSD